MSNGNQNKNTIRLQIALHKITIWTNKQNKIDKDRKKGDEKKRENTSQVTIGPT